MENSWTDLVRNEEVLRKVKEEGVTVIIGSILLVVKILYLIDWAVVLQLTGIEG